MKFTMTTAPATLLLGALALGCADPPVAAHRLDYAEPLLEGRLALIDGNYERAFEILLPRAKQGHDDAQNLVGVMFLEGWGAERSSKQAQLWIGRAADQRHPKAMHNMGRMARNGWGTNRNSALAIIWYRRAAEAGYPPAQAVLGGMYSTGEAVDVDHDEARKWLRLAAAQGEQSARVYLIEHYPILGE